MSEVERKEREGESVRGEQYSTITARMNGISQLSQ